MATIEGSQAGMLENVIVDASCSLISCSKNWKDSSSSFFNVMFSLPKLLFSFQV